MYHEQPCVNVQVEPRRSITKKSNLAHLLSLRATFHTRGGGGTAIFGLYGLYGYVPL